MRKRSLISGVFAGLFSLPLWKTGGASQPLQWDADEPTPIAQAKPSNPIRHNEFYTVDENGGVNVDGREFMKLTNDEMTLDSNYGRRMQEMTDVEYQEMRRIVRNVGRSQILHC